MSASLPMLRECATKAGCRAIDELPVAYMEVDREGLVRYVNRAAQQMHDPALGELIGRSIWALMPPAETESNRLDFETAMETGQAPPVVLRSIYTKAGTYRMYEVHRGLMLDAAGKPVGMRLASFDVTEMEQACKSAQQSRDWMESVLDSVTDAVIVADALGYVLYVNPACEKLTGWRREELVGMQIERGLPLVSFQSSDTRELDFQAVLARKWQGRAVLLDRNLQQLPVELSASPIVDREQGYTTGVVGVMRRIDDGSAGPASGPDPDCDCGLVIVE